MTRLPVLALALAAAAAASPALASTDEAWAAFRKDVDSQCRALVTAPKGAKIMVEVSPEGSESYGAALVTVGLPAGGAERSICIMDKHSKKAQLASPLPETVGEGSLGGGMGKAQQKGPTAGDARAPMAKPAAKSEAPKTDPKAGEATTNDAPAASKHETEKPAPKPAG